MIICCFRLICWNRRLSCRMSSLEYRRCRRFKAAARVASCGSLVTWWCRCRRGKSWSVWSWIAGGGVTGTRGSCWRWGTGIIVWWACRCFRGFTPRCSWCLGSRGGTARRRFGSWRFGSPADRVPWVCFWEAAGLCWSLSICWAKCQYWYT